MARIMVVDDEDVLLEMIAAVVEDLGHEPIIATDGREALAILVANEAAKTPALILSDVMMPRMNGIELAQRVKQDSRFRAVPFVLMSAAGQPRDHNVADNFIPKPFDMDMLTDLIEQYVQQSLP